MRNFLNRHKTTLNSNSVYICTYDSSPSLYYGTSPHLSASTMNALKNSSEGENEGGGQGPVPDVRGMKKRSVSLTELVL